MTGTRETYVVGWVLGEMTNPVSDGDDGDGILGMADELLAEGLCPGEEGHGGEERQAIEEGRRSEGGLNSAGLVCCGRSGTD